MLHAFATLLLFQLVGASLVRLVVLPVPRPVLGMVLLLLYFTARGGVSEALHAVSSVILRHLSLLFVPAGVGLVIQVARIRTEWEAITGALLASTALTLVVTAVVFRLFARRQARGAR